MNWPDERYVRIYTRDTMGWLKLGWEAQALFYLILRQADRAGVVSDYDDPDGLASFLRMPPEVVRRELPRLIKNGCIAERPGYLIVPNYVEAQEAHQTDAQRQRDFRDRRKALALAGELGIRSRTVTILRDEPPVPLVTPCDEPPVPSSREDPKTGWDGHSVPSVPSVPSHAVQPVTVSASVSRQAPDPNDKPPWRHLAGQERYDAEQAAYASIFAAAASVAPAIRPSVGRQDQLRRLLEQWTAPQLIESVVGHSTHTDFWQAKREWRTYFGHENKPTEWQTAVERGIGFFALGKGLPFSEKAIGSTANKPPAPAEPTPAYHDVWVPPDWMPKPGEKREPRKMPEDIRLKLEAACRMTDLDGPAEPANG